MLINSINGKKTSNKALETWTLYIKSVYFLVLPSCSSRWSSYISTSHGTGRCAAFKISKNSA